MSLVNVEIRVENNYMEDMVVKSQDPTYGRATRKLPDSILSGGGRGSFMAYSTSAGDGVYGKIVFSYLSRGSQSFILSYQYGGSYEAKATVTPTMIGNVVARLNASPDKLTYSISLEFNDPAPPVNVEIRVENNYMEDMVVKSQDPTHGRATRKLPDSILSGGGRGSFMACSTSAGDGVYGKIVFSYLSRGSQSFILSYQYGGSYEAKATVTPTMIGNVVARLNASPDKLTYSISLEFNDPAPPEGE